MIYFARCEQTGNVKIGNSRNPIARVQSMRTARNMRLIGVLPGREAEERHLHAAFAKQRVYGEWFTSSPRLADLLDIAAVCLVSFVSGGNFAVAALEMGLADRWPVEQAARDLAVSAEDEG